MLIFALSVSAFPLSAQNITVSGYVTDSETGEPLLGAGVVLSETNGSVTNDYGHYSIGVPAEGASLRYSFLGYSDSHVEIKAVRDTMVNVALKRDASLSEATVSAYSESGIRSRYMGTMEVQSSAIRNTVAPLGEPDVLKTLQMLPGVQAGTNGFSGMYVRGGGHDETMYLMDGAPMYNVSHLLGLLSSFAPEAVKKVTLYKGPFPARYGGRTSGIVDVRTNDGDMHRTKGSVSVGLLTDRVHVEGPILKNKLTYSVSARVLHTFLVGPVLRWSGVGMNYYFYDLNGKLSWQVSPRDRMYLSAYFGDDRFWSELPYSDGSTSDMRWGNKIVSARWTHSFDAPLFLDASVYWTDYRYDSDWLMVSERDELASGGRATSRTKSSIIDFGATADLEWKTSERNSLRAGISLINHRYNPRSYVTFETGGLPSDDYESSLNTIGWENAVYVEDNLRLGRFGVNAGIRGVQMSSGRNVFWSFEPRLTLNFDFGRGISAKAAAGRSSQYVHLLTSSSMKGMSVPSDMWIPVTEKIRPVTADICSAGIYYSGLSGWEFSLEAYMKDTDNVIDFRDGSSTVAFSSESLDEAVSTGVARSRGLEFYVRKTAGNTTGWLSYTLAKTDRRYPDGSVNGGRWFPDTYDRRHNISISVSHKFNERMDLTATWIYMSGAMATVPDSYTAALLPSYDGVKLYPFPVPAVSSKNNYRLPATHRLDLGFNLRKQGKRGENVWTFGIYNVYNAHNPDLVYFLANEALDDNEFRYVMNQMTFLPILPSVSYTFNF